MLHKCPKCTFLIDTDVFTEEEMRFCYLCRVSGVPADDDEQAAFLLGGYDAAVEVHTAKRLALLMYQLQRGRD